MDLSRRSDLKELLDRDDIPFADIERNMRELDIINSRLGGHAITLAGFKELVQWGKTGIGAVQEKRLQQGDLSGLRATGNGGRGAVAPLVVAEIGCGGGDNLVAIRKYCERIGLDVQFIGVDLNPHCIAVAASKFSATEARWITADYRDISFWGDRPDILFSSLFCHHFSDADLVEMLRWMQKESTIGFFINDLERNLWAYRSISVLVSLFSRSYLVKHDAPLSVLRGFRRAEWERLLQRAGIKEYSLEWKWAFRWLLIV